MRALASWGNLRPERGSPRPPRDGELERRDGAGEVARSLFKEAEQLAAEASAGKGSELGRRLTELRSALG